MDGITIDTLEYAKKLEAAGFTREQAEAQAEIFKANSDAQSALAHKLLDDRAKDLATKTDLKELELRLLKWQIGGWIALATIMAKGFGWLGF